MVQFGPGDYSISIGHPGEWTHPKVKEAELKTIKTALEFGIRPRAECTVEDAQKYIDLGVRDFCIGVDLEMISNWCQVNGSKLRELLQRGA
jgi:4-hydroxy-2-oxoheptanedioate aldolase